MNRETTTAHIGTWQFFSSCIEIFKPLSSTGGKGYLSKLFNVSTRQIERWSCDPDFSESAQRNPMDKYEIALKRLVELGRKDMAIGAVNRQAEIIGCVLTCASVEPDKSSVSDELLDDLPAVSTLHSSIREKRDVQEVRENLTRALDEIRQSYEIYVRQI